MKALLRKLLNYLKCQFLGHDYTCAVDEGIPPTSEQLNNIPEGFHDYAKTYCRRCSHVYKPAAYK